MWSPSDGQPTQIHAVPLEERAVDSQGQTLPWAEEWHESVTLLPSDSKETCSSLLRDHPNARYNKSYRIRRPVEKGAFGHGRRKIQGRINLAKKENPTVDGFERAMKHDLQKAADEARLEAIASSRDLSDSSSRQSRHAPPSTTKEPTEVMFYGYSPSTVWAAISFYETVSSGRICEDYEREPPSELRKYPHFSSTASRVYSQALTKAERVLASKFRGGNCWIKVTFDSAEASERAISNSPHLVNGHWVYAEPFRGTGPEVDEPILMRKEDREKDPRGAPSPPRPSKRVGPSSARNKKAHSRRGAKTVPQPSTGKATTEAEAKPAAAAPAATLELPPLAHDPRFFTHFPNVPRTILRPAHEAFLPPSPSWFEATVARLAAAGYLPEGIGNGVPQLENGDFDWARAGLYWKLFYWIDLHLGTDFCGLKDE